MLNIQYNGITHAKYQQPYIIASFI